jgi:hypothetical protein
MGTNLDPAVLLTDGLDQLDLVGSCRFEIALDIGMERRLVVFHGQKIVGLGAETTNALFPSQLIIVVAICDRPAHHQEQHLGQRIGDLTGLTRVLDLEAAAVAWLKRLISPPSAPPESVRSEGISPSRRRRELFASITGKKSVT